MQEQFDKGETMKKVAVLAAILLAGCGSIERHDTIQQKVGQELEVGVGDVVLSIERK